MRGKQWDCISTLTGLLFVIFATIMAITSTWFWNNITVFLLIATIIFIIYVFAKKENTTSEYQLIQKKIIENNKNKSNQVEHRQIENDVVRIYELDKETYKTRIVTFKKFLGFNKNNIKDDIIKKLGEPTKDENLNKHEFNTLNYSNILLFDYNKITNLLEGIEIDTTRDIEKGKNYLIQLNLSDNNTNFIGKDKNDIHNYFGKPSREIGNFMFYEFKSFEVYFYCHHSICSIIRVSYNN